MSTGEPTVKSRRAQYSEATRQALIEAATGLFVERGFSGTALADVAAAAQVTRGAVYHHFADKRALFEAVLERLELHTIELVRERASAGRDPWDAAMRGLEACLDQCCDPVHGRVVWQEGPLALGWKRWRECELEYAYGLIEEFVSTLIDSGYLPPAAPLTTVTRLVFAMIGETGLALSEVADIEEKLRLRAEYEATIRRILEGLRAAP
jgi:AcrR family transcriptional regulator